MASWEGEAKREAKRDDPGPALSLEFPQPAFLHRSCCQAGPLWSGWRRPVSRAFAMPVPTPEHTHHPESGLQRAGMGQEALRSGWFQEREKGTSGYIHNVVH